MADFTFPDNRKSSDTSRLSLGKFSEVVMSNNPNVFYEFGPFRIDRRGQQLWREDQEIPLTPKAFGVLLMLVENPGETLLKDYLMKAVWPDAFVEENNLTDNISILRRALNDDPKAPQ